MKYCVPSKTLFRENIQNKDSFLSNIGPKRDGGRFKKKGIGRGSWGVFVEKFKNGGRDPIFFMVATLTQHAWHAKSQSAATFC